jgi:hypothetical protein
MGQSGVDADMGATNDSRTDLTYAADPAVSISVVVAGIRVEKSIVTDAFPVPAVAISVDSLHDEPVTVRIEDEVPASVPLADLGTDGWETVDDERIAWTGRLESGAERVTTYGVDADPEAVDDLQTPPTVDTVMPE